MPTRGQLRIDAVHLGAVLGALTVLCFVLVTLGSLTISGASHGLLDWVHLTVILVGLVFHGTVRGSAQVAGSAGSVHVSVAPLTMTVLVLVAVAVVSRRAERVLASDGWKQALARCGCMALATGALGILGSLLSHLTISGLESVDVHLTLLSAFLPSTLLVAAAAAWGRVRSSLLPSSVVAVRLATTRRAAYGLLTVVGIGAVLAVLALFVASVTGRLGDSSPASSSAGEVSSGGALAVLVGLVGFGANLLVLGAGVVAGIPVEGRALLTRSWSLFSDGVPWGYTVLPVLFYGLTALVGAYVGLREDPREIWWKTLCRWTAVSLVGWLLLAWLSGSYAGASVSTDLFGLGEAGSDAFGLGLTTGIAFLVSLLVGGGLFLGVRFVLPEVAGAFPARTARCGRRSLHPVWGLRLADAQVRRGELPAGWLMDLADSAAAEDVTPLPASRRRLALAGATALGCLLLLAGSVVGLRMLRTTVYGPAATVEDYLGAVGDGRATDALSALVAHDTSPLLSSKVLLAEVRRDPITEVSTHVTGQGDGTASVRASYRQGDAEVTREYTLHTADGDGRVLGLFPRWAITSGALETLSVTTDGNRAVAVEGVALTGDSAQVFPGRLTVTSPGDLVTADASQVADLRRAGGERSVQIVTSVRSSAHDAIEKKVGEVIAACAKSTSLDPQGCPFSTYGFDASRVTWTVKAAPVVDVGEVYDGSVSFTGHGTMHVRYLQGSSFGAPAEWQSEDVNYSLYGQAADQSGALAVSLQ